MKRFLLLVAGLCLALPVLRAAPTTTGVSGTNVTLGQTVTFTGWAEDGDVPVHWLHFYVTGPGLPGWNYAGSAEVNDWSVQGSIDWNPGEAGGYAVHVRAENWNGEWDWNGNQVSGFDVSPANSAPQTNWSSGDNGVAGQATTLRGNATDPDGNLSAMNFYVTGPGMPGWNYVGGTGIGGGDATGTINWTPPGPGSYAVHIRAWDSWGWVDWNANIMSGFEVAEGNHAPRTESVQAGSGTAGSPMTFTGRATDPDGNLNWMQFYVTGPGMSGWNPVGGTSASGGDASVQVTWTPPQKGDYAVHIRASDTENAIDWNANVATNFSVGGRAPTGTISLPNGSSASVGQAVVIQVAGSDADSDLHYINIDQTTPALGTYGPGDTGTQAPPNNGAYNLGAYYGNYTRNLSLTFNLPGTYTFRGAMNDDSGWYYTPNTVTVNVSDTTPPSVPTSPEAHDIGANSFRFTWVASTDNVAVAHYEVYINGVPKGTTTLNSFLFAGLAPNSNFSPAVRAFDAAGNHSGFVWLMPEIHTLDGPPPSGVQSAWLDVNGDGIRDEIVRPGSPDFGYQITQWYTPNPAYIQTLVNLFFGFENVIFDLNSSAPLVLNYGSGQTTLDNNNVAPDFGSIWDPAWFPGAESWGTSYLDLEFHANLEAGYDYMITSTDHPDSISPQLMDTEVPLFTAATTGGVSFYRQNLSPYYLQGRYFHLVRLGKPLTSIQLAIGGSTLNVSNGGSASIVIPASGNVLLRGLDALNRILQGGPQVIWRLLDILGNEVQPWSVSDAIDAGIFGEGSYTVQTKLDNDQTRSFTLNFAAPQNVIGSLQWIEVNSPIDNQPSGSPGGGRRIFAGKQSPGDNVNRQQVKLRATFSSGGGGQVVYFKVFDVDDPSSNNSVLDDESDPADNRGPTNSGTVLTRTTDSSGVAEIDFEVSMQPGNNYRGVAALSEAQLNSLSAKQNDGTAARIQTSTGAIAKSSSVMKISEMLTVWRKIHIETDVMGAPVGNEVAVTVSTVENADINNRKITTDLTPATLGDSIQRFETGTVKQGQNSWPIKSGSVGTNAAGFVFLTVDSSFGGPFPQTGAITIRDDDMTAAPSALDTSYVATAFKLAYIEPVFVSNQTGVPFPVSFNAGDPSGPLVASRNSQLATADYWAVYLVGGFQGFSFKDHDPDSELPVQLGQVFPAEGQKQIAVIFKENIRDSLNEGIEAVTVAHELGHYLGARHTPQSDHTLMAVEVVTDPTFSPESLAEIRGNALP